MKKILCVCALGLASLMMSPAEGMKAKFAFFQNLTKKNDEASLQVFPELTQGQIRRYEANGKSFNVKNVSEDTIALCTKLSNLKGMGRFSYMAETYWDLANGGLLTKQLINTPEDLFCILSLMPNTVGLFSITVFCGFGYWNKFRENIQSIENMLEFFGMKKCNIDFIKKWYINYDEESDAEESSRLDALDKENLTSVEAIESAAGAAKLPIMEFIEQHSGCLENLKYEDIISLIGKIPENLRFLFVCFSFGCFPGTNVYDEYFVDSNKLQSFLESIGGVLPATDQDKFDNKINDWKKKMVALEEERDKAEEKKAAKCAAEEAEKEAFLEEEEEEEEFFEEEEEEEEEAFLEGEERPNSNN